MKRKIKNQIRNLFLTLTVCAFVIPSTVLAVEPGNEQMSHNQGSTIQQSVINIVFKDIFAPGKIYNGKPLNNPLPSELKMEGTEYHDLKFTWYKCTGENTVICDTPVDAGVYYLVVSVHKPDGTEVYSVNSEPVTVSQLDISNHADIVITLNDSPVFDGSEKTQLIKSIVLDDLMLTEGKDYIVTDNTATDAGSYHLTIQGQGNFTGTYSVPWQILEPADVFTEIPAAKTLVYNGAPQELVTAGLSNHGTVVYSLEENGEYTEMIPAAVEAGQYTVWYYIEESGSMSSRSNMEKNAVEAEIKKAIPAYELPVDLKAVHGQTLGDIILSNGFSWQDDLSVSVGDEGQNTFKVIYTPADTVNYEVITDLEVLVQVAAQGPDEDQSDENPDEDQEDKDQEDEDQEGENQEDENQNDDDHQENDTVPSTDSVSAAPSNENPVVSGVKEAENIILQEIIEEESTVTVPVSEEENGLDEADQEQQKNEFSVESIQSIVKNADDTGNTEVSMTVHLDSGIVEIDYAALCAILEQAEGSEVQLILEDSGMDNLNEQQKESLENYEVHGGIEASLLCVDSGRYISDFQGGAVTLRIPFSVPESYEAERFSIWYIDDEGAMTRQDTIYEDGYLIWKVGHFSDFVIIYEEPAEEIPVITEEEEQPQTTNKGQTLMNTVVLLILVGCVCLVAFLFWKNREELKEDEGN